MPIPFRNIWKWVRRLALGVTLFLLALAALFLLPSVQTWAAQKAVKVLHSRLGLDVAIGSLTYRFPNAIELQDVLLRDDHQDTVIRIGYLSSRIDYANRNFSVLNIGRTNFDQLDIYLHRQAGDSLNGFQYFLQKFKSDSKKTKKPFQLQIAALHMERIRFKMWKDDCQECFHLFWPKAELNANSIVIRPDSIGAELQHVSFVDPERFSLSHLEGQAHFAKRSSSISNWLMITDSSRVEGDADLHYQSTADFADFIKKVDLDIHFSETRLSFREAHRFHQSIPTLPSMDLELDLHGTLDSLLISRLHADPNGPTLIDLNGAMYGLTAANGPELNLFIDQLESSGDRLHFVMRQLKKEELLPSQLDSIGLFSLSGHYEGNQQQFAFDGQLRSALGELISNAQFTLDSTGRGKHQLKGTLRFDRLRVDQLSGQSSLGMAKGGLAMDLEFRGKNLPQGRLKGALDAFEWNQHVFTNISLDASVEQERFTGSLNVMDPLLDLQFFGNADLDITEGNYDFQARLNKLDLAGLGWVKDSIGLLSTQVSIQAKGVFPEMWDGSVRFTETTYEDPLHFYFFNELELRSQQTDSMRRIDLHSDILRLKAEGDFKPSAFPRFLTNYFNRYSGRDTANQSEVNHFTLSAELIRPDIINELLVPKLQVDPGTKLTARYNQTEDILHIDFNARSISYDQWLAYDVQLKDREEINGLLLSVKDLQYQDKEFMDIELATLKGDDSLQISLHGVLVDTVNAQFDLGTQMWRVSDTSYVFHWMPSAIQYGSYLIQNEGQGDILVEPHRTEVQGLVFKSKEGRMFVNGNISKSPYQILRLSFADFELGIFNPYLRLFDTELSGGLDGEVIISQVLAEPRYALTLSTDETMINQQNMGKLELWSDWSQYTGVTDLGGNIDKGSLRMFELEGKFFPDSLYADFALKLNRFNLNVLEPYTKGIFSKLRGFAEGELSFCGPLGQLGVEGELELPNAAFTIPVLNTDYSLQARPKVRITDQKISLVDAVIRDTEFGTQGVANLNITHDFFQNIYLDLRIQADRLLAMNTSAEQSPFYYGTAFGTGLIQLAGSLDKMRLEVDAKAEKGTVFSIPMGGPKEVVGSSFITFREPDRLILDRFRMEQNLRQEGKSNPLEIYFDLEVTPEAELEIIVDEQNGDKMRGRGKGNIQLQISREGEVQMLGGVTVEKGYYLFTLTGIVNRRFDLVQGGTIRWNGTPYDSQIDLRALYSTRLSLGPVLDEYKGIRTDLQLYLLLRDDLMNPTIDFQIKAPQATSDAQAKLENYFADKDRLNRQAFAVLSMNTLLAEDGTNSGGGVFSQTNITNNTYQVLTSQVSNWLNSGVNFIDINVNYVGSEDPGVTNDEFEVGLSKKLLNDRLTINGEFDVPVGEAQNQQQQVLVGDVELVYDITPDGRFKARVFNETNDQLNGQITTTYTQGLGIFYTTDFQTFPDLVRKIMGIKPKNEGKVNSDEVD